MDSAPDNNRWDTTRKKYILSLKNRFQLNTKKTVESEDNTMDNKILLDKQIHSEFSEFGDSQNFSLRLSDSFIVDETLEVPQRSKNDEENRRKKETEIIVISDSSDDDCTDKVRLHKEIISLSNSRHPNLNTSMTFSSIDMSEIRTDDEKWSTTSRNKEKSIGLEKKDIEKCSLLTSDGENNVNFDDSDDKNDTHKTDSSTQHNRLILLRDDGNHRNHRDKLQQDHGKIISTSSSNLNHLQDIPRRHNVQGTPNSAKCGIRTTPLTMKDARDITRIIKSKRAVYNSPGQQHRQKKIIDSDSDTSEDSKASGEIENNKKNKKHPVWINETDSESGETTPDNNQKRTGLIKTHVSRFLDPTVTDYSSEEMSLRKKEEISRWLHSNPVDSRSDTSMSYVPPSEQNSLSSGNSSLDRLELKYETPNNRDKFKSRKYVDDDKTNTISTVPKQVQTVKVRQTTMDSFLRKVKCNDRDISYYTPIPLIKTKKVISPIISPGETSNIQIGDCADILDELYGDVWRDKAEDLFSRSEPRKANPKVQDRAVQTGRKKATKPQIKGTSISAANKNSSDNDFNTFMSNIKPHLNSTKKSQVQNRKWRNSFIDDSSSPDCSDGETTYQTALTTPRISDLQTCKKKETPMSALTMRAIEICDSDSEDHDYASPIKKINNNARRLSFSDDEIDLRSSPGTSEYDPDDVIPPKSVIRQRNIIASKSSTKSSTYTRTGATKSFLASLSSSVPIANAHPDAKKFRTSYKNTRDDLCKYLYKLYNDKIFNSKLPDDMLIEWNVRMRGTAGFCYNKTRRKALGAVERSSRIVLATKILDAPDRLRDTLVHEMCHAATWLINEVSDGHGPFWQAWASKAMKVFPELPSIKRCHDYKIATKYTYRCASCGYSIGRHSKSLDVERKRCGHCYGKFELLINKVTKSGMVQVKTPSKKKPTGFALFVKENYHSVKKERRDMGHKEVMQILGQQFSAVKISKENNNVDH